jgi:hypothetical protein
MIFPNIEDYLTFLYKALRKQILKVTSYEHDFIVDSTNRVCLAQPLTDKQSVFALNLIKKYEHQLSHLDVQQPDHSHFMNGIVTIDRSTYLKFDGEFIRLKVSKQFSDQIKQKVKEMHGTVVWDFDQVNWKLALTEHNVSWVVSFAMSKYLPIDESLIELYNNIQTVKTTPYKIELIYDGELRIQNAPPSMVEYIEANVGFTDLIKLVDYSPILEYTVSADIANTLINEFSNDFLNLCLNRRLTLPRTYDISHIISYASIVNRYPIFVYNVGLSTLDKYKQFFEEDEILVLTSKNVNQLELLNNIKLIYSNVMVDSNMPLLISYAGFRYSTKCKQFEQQAEKIVFLVK